MTIRLRHNSLAATPAPGDRGASAWTLAAVLALVAAPLVTFKLKNQPLFIDFLAMWTGGRLANADPARLYDFVAVDRAQAWLLGAAAHDRPFPYPPSALTVFGPLSGLPFWTAAAVWMILTLAAYAVVVLWLPQPRRALASILIALSPGVVWAAISGQCVFLTGALAIAAVVLLDRRPWLAGVLLGVAAAFKPTVVILAPVILAAGGHWRAMAGAAIGGVALIAASVAAYGLGPWRDWLAVAPTYLDHITHNPHFYTSIITPTGLGVRLGLTGAGLTAWRAAFAVLGLGLAVVGFRRPRPLAVRLTILFGASFLASPYAMNYETALLAPGAALALTTAESRPSWTAALAAFGALAAAGLPVASAAALLVFLVLSLAPSLLTPGPLAPRPPSEPAPLR